MANWIYNKIEFRGEMASLDDMKAKLKELMANKSCQIMGHLLGKKSSGVDWQEHNLREYGTKSDPGVERCSISISDDIVILRFETAWNPPFNFLTSICRKHNIEAQMVYDSVELNISGIAFIDHYGDIINKTYCLDEGRYHAYHDIFVSSVTNSIDSYVDKGWTKTEEELSFLSVEDLYEINKIFKRRSLERLFDDPPIGVCFKNRYDYR